MDNLKPCPFCGGSASFERIGDKRQSTIVRCDMCGCSLESGDEWNHCSSWNRRDTDKLEELCKKFIENNNISCSETVFQSDRIIENAYEFIEKICDIVGYKINDD